MIEIATMPSNSVYTIDVSDWRSLDAGEQDRIREAANDGGVQLLISGRVRN